VSRVAEQSFLNTRVSIMATRLFSPGYVVSLLDQGPAQLGEHLGLSLFADGNLSPRTKNRAIEQSLIETLLAELTILTRPMGPPQRQLVVHWGQKFALFNLKAMIRGKIYRLDNREIQDNLYELPPIVRLPYKELFGAENVLEMLRQLEPGPYSLIARQARELYEQKREPFALEAAIDQMHYSGLAREVRELHDADQRPLQQVVGALLDQIALLWLLRFRFAYQMSPSETFYQLVPSLRAMNRERLLQLVNLDGVERVLDAVPPPLGPVLVGSASLVDVQKRLNRYRAREARRVLRHSDSGVARALAYLILREMDLRLLFALIQGKLLDLPLETISIAVELADPNCPLGPWAQAA
jgi:V/A-type H+/Na+-transporting ATPase subunit C